jgi:hypothetical protein
MKVKLFVSGTKRAHDGAALPSKPGIKRDLLWSSLWQRFCARGENHMSPEITMPLIAVVMALSFPALTAGNGDRGNVYLYKSAQYCMPYDDLADVSRVYC